MKYSLILCLVLVSLLSTTIARKHGSHSGPPGLRIVGGHMASLRSHPYIVSLQIDIILVKLHYCGGSLLNKRWVVTAAHCVDGFFVKWLPMAAIVGTNDHKNIDSTAQTLRISERIPHPNYNSKTVENDIAMLKTANSIQYNDAVHPIKFSLPMRGRQKTRNLIVAGWGLLGTPNEKIASLFSKPALPDKLQEVRVEYLPIHECRKALDANSIEKDSNSQFKLKKVGHICTGPITGGVSACTGDSGGPLIQYILYNNKDITDTTQITTEDIEYETTPSGDRDSGNEESNDDIRSAEDKDKSSSTPQKVFEGSPDIVQNYKAHGLIPVLLGIVSWGQEPCGSVGSPTVHTNVSIYADFIHKHLNE